MKNVIINGFSLSVINRKTGIEQFCQEVIYGLDKIKPTEIQFYYIYDENGYNTIIEPEKLKNIIPIKEKYFNFEKKLKFNSFKRTKILKKYQKKLKAYVLCLAFELYYGKNQLAVIHDIRSLVTKFDSFKFRLRSKIMMMIIQHYCKNIFTVSNYQKKLISKHTKISKENIDVLYLGYEHLKNIVADYSIFDNFSNIKRGDYYLAIGSLAPHKNFKWIVEVAKRNPNQNFVIVGGKDLSVWKDNIEVKDIKNLIFTGYVSDEEKVALLKESKGFLHPSKFEGFGLPPIEALFFGVKTAVAKATCLPEIYEDCVLYFDPDDYDVDIEEMFNGETKDPQKVFDKCSWEKCVNNVYERLLKMEDIRWNYQFVWRRQKVQMRALQFL